MGLRPEHIVQGEGQPATVRRLERLGDQTRLHLRLGPHEIVTLADPHSRLSPGDTISIRPQTPLWFDAAGNRI
jgi:multiple sugar transport system ATP-binding protein